MKVVIKQLVIVVYSSALLACSTSNEASTDAYSEANNSRSDCISRSSIRGYSVLDESNLIVEASGRRNYHVVLRRRAYGLRSTWGIAFDSQSSRVCARFSEVIFEGHMEGNSISIASIRELDPENHEELLIRFGKKKPEIEQTPVPREVKGADVEELDPAANDDSSGN